MSTPEIIPARAKWTCDGCQKQEEIPSMQARPANWSDVRGNYLPYNDLGEANEAPSGGFSDIRTFHYSFCSDCSAKVEKGFNLLIESLSK